MSKLDRRPRATVGQPWRPQFGLGAMLLFMLVICVTASGGYYLVQAVHGGISWTAVFVIFVLIAPMLLMSILSLGMTVLAWLGPRRRRHR